jgi:hypothetical protein
MPWSPPAILQASIVVEMSETAAGCKKLLPLWLGVGMLPGRKFAHPSTGGGAAHSDLLLLLLLLLPAPDGRRRRFLGFFHQK